MNKSGGERIPVVTQQEQAMTRAYEREDIARRSLDFPDGRRIIVNAENSDEVMVTVVRRDGSRDLRTYSRAKFDEITDEYEASQTGSETGNNIENRGEEVAQSEKQPDVSTPSVNNESVTNKHPIQMGETYISSKGDIVVVDEIRPDGTVQVSMDNPLKPGSVSAREFESKDSLAAYLDELGVDGMGRTARAAEAENALATDIPQHDVAAAQASATPLYTPGIADKDRVRQIPVDVTTQEQSLSEPRPLVSPDEPRKDIEPGAANSEKSNPEDFDAIAARLAQHLAEPGKLSDSQTTPKTVEELATEREQMQAKLADLRKQYGLQMDKQSSRARQIKAEIDDLHKTIADSFEMSATLEQPKTHREELYDELDEARSKLNDMGDKKSPEAKALLKRMKEIHVEIAEDFEREYGTDVDEAEAEDEAVDDEPAITKAEMEEKRKQVIEKIDKEIRTTPEFAKYRDALNRYAELKADNDTKGWFGHKKRERLLDEAETRLVETKKALAVAVIRERGNAGLYNGEEAEMKQVASDDLFEQIRKIDPETRDMTNKVLIERQKGRNIFQRAAVKFGHFLNRGDKAVKRYAKNAGVGVVIGLVKGGFLGALGATWPVGIPVAAAVNAGFLAASRYGAKTDQLDQVLKTHIDEEGKAIPELNDEQFAKLLSSVGDRIPESMQGREGKMTDMLARGILSGSREAGVSEKKAATARANKNVAAMGIGMALGGAVGGFSARAIHDAWGAAHTPTVTNLAPNPNDMPPHIETPPAVEVPKGPELVGNSFQVESGNGLIREWSQWATANGHPLDGPTSEALHRAVLEKFGPNGIIDLNNVNDAKEIYTQGGDVRLSAPGAAHWRTGVAEYAQQWLQQQGKW